MYFIERRGEMGRIAGAVGFAAVALAALPLQAEPFLYVGRDMLLGFRQAEGVSELVVNLGQASNYFTATPGSTIVLSNFTPVQLQNAFATFNDLLWSVSATTRSGDGGDPSIPNAHSLGDTGPHGSGGAKFSVAAQNGLQPGYDGKQDQRVWC
jgi:hypothetical protein